MVCAKCKNNLDKQEIAITCDSCGRGAHRDCSGLNASEMKVMDLKGKRSLKFYCEDCQAGIKLIPKLIAKIDSLEADLKAIIQQNQQSAILSEEGIFNEINERQKRANNVMIYNLPENGHDIEEVKNISREITENVDTNIVRVVRVGKRNKNGARPLKVIFHSSEDALMILRNKRKLNRNRKIFLEPDMTTIQMSNMKKLKEELRTRKDNGEKVAIRYKSGMPVIVSLN